MTVVERCMGLVKGVYMLTTLIFDRPLFRPDFITLLKNLDTGRYTFSNIPGDFVTKVKQINSQSDLIWMSSFAGPFYLTNNPLSTSF